MEWGSAYTLSRALEMRVTPEGALIATNSISRAHLHLTPDSVLVLLSFAGGVSAGQALGRLQDRFAVSREGFAATASGLIEAGFVVPFETTRAAAPATGHFADVMNHVHMLADRVRVEAYRAAIERNVAGKHVLDLGCGSGVLSLLAARAGAASVIAVEESAVATLAEAVFAAARADITLVQRSSRDVELDQPVDVIVHELLGADPLAEGILPSIADARRRLLAPRGRLIPNRLEILCVGVDVGPVAVDRAGALAVLRAVAGVADAMTPLAAAVAGLPPRAFVTTLGDAPFQVLTEPCLLHDLDLMQVDEHACAALLERALVVSRAGHLNAILTWFRAHLDEHTVIENAPDAPVTHWGRRIMGVSSARRVAPGDRVAVRAWRETNLAHEQIIIDTV